MYASSTWHREALSKHCISSPCLHQGGVLFFHFFTFDYWCLEDKLLLPVPKFWKFLIENMVGWVRVEVGWFKGESTVYIIPLNNCISPFPFTLIQGTGISSLIHLFYLSADL